MTLLKITKTKMGVPMPDKTEGQAVKCLEEGGLSKLARKSKSLIRMMISMNESLDTQYHITPLFIF
jgi:hypothetical protein